MMTHSVYFWLEPSLTPLQKAEFERGLKALFKIEMVSAGRFGKAADTPTRSVTRNTFDYALFLEFDSVKAHNAYQEHRDHEAFVSKFSPWFRKVRVFDTRISD